MSLSNTVKNLWVKIEDQEEDTLQLDIEERAFGRNTKQMRQQLLRIAHYYHLLQNLGDMNANIEKNIKKMEQCWTLAKLKIQKAKDYEGRWREIAEANLIDEHTRAWNLAEYYYEKATKILCQMTITLMDYLLQEQAGFSILYNGKDKSSYFNLLDEITSLNGDYIECCCFLSAYDYCTQKIADFTGIEEYRQLVKEHERIVKNGMPDRVTEAMQKLREIAGESKEEYFIDICRAYTPKPPYYEDILEEKYRKAVDYYGGEVNAMAMFSKLVIKTDEYYEACIKE